MTASVFLQHWELLVLQVLDWDLSAVTPYCILEQLLRRYELSECGFDANQVRRHSETFIALAETEFDISSSLSPGLLAVSCLVGALNGLKRDEAQEKFSSRLLMDLASDSGHSAAAIAEAVRTIEVRLKERLPRPSEAQAPVEVDVRSPCMVY